MPLAFYCLPPNPLPPWKSEQQSDEMPINAAATAAFSFKALHILYFPSPWQHHKHCLLKASCQYLRLRCLVLSLLLFRPVKNLPAVTAFTQKTGLPLPSPLLTVLLSLFKKFNTLLSTRLPPANISSNSRSSSPRAHWLLRRSAVATREPGLTPLAQDPGRSPFPATVFGVYLVPARLQEARSAGPECRAPEHSVPGATRPPRSPLRATSPE